MSEWFSQSTHSPVCTVGFLPNGNSNLANLPPGQTAHSLGPGVVEARINLQIKHVVIVEMNGIVMDVNTIAPHILQHVLHAGL